MNCIVTAGPTYEPLDDVRRLTNFSTGRLGTELANFLAARGHKVDAAHRRIGDLAGERKAQRVEIFSTTADLRAKLKSFSGKKVDAIFHAAAVSDFAFGKIFAPDAAENWPKSSRRKKFPRAAETCSWNLCRRRKSLRNCAAGFRKTKIVGWKFEADGRRADAIARGRKANRGLRDGFVRGERPGLRQGFGLVQHGKQKHFAEPAILFDALEKLSH